MSVSVCVWAMLPDSNKMMIYVSWFTKNIDSLGLSCLLQFAREQCVKAIVMTPTRELCNQAAKNIAVRCIQVTSVRPILRIGEYSLVALQHRRIRYIGLRVSADAE